MLSCRTPAHQPTRKWQTWLRNTYRIIAHSLEPAADAVEQVVEVVLVLLVIELAANLTKAVGMVVAVGFEDVARLEQDLKEEISIQEERYEE